MLYEEEEPTSQQNTVTKKPYEEKENILTTPHIIPPDEPQPKIKIKPCRSMRILTTKLPANISRPAEYHFLGNAIQMNEVVIRPINLPNPKIKPTVRKQ